MSAAVTFSVIVPVYNRPDEIRELLESLAQQTFTDFEVLVVEDGSSVRCDTVVDACRDKLRIQYFYKPNAGPGPGRNYGSEKAAGNYFVYFDSDCIIPPDYFQIVYNVLREEGIDAWGGPDRGHADFTPVQQAMAYTMASVLTTGGIRGSKRVAEKFQPRSFNMGISRKVFEATGGFHFDRLAEDIELSVRIRKAGFRIMLIEDAYVFHKRRTSLKQFYRQVAGFGRGRVRVGRAHPGEVKVVHWFPAVFVIGLASLPVVLVVSSFLFKLTITLYLVYLAAIGADAGLTTKSVTVALLSIPSALVQLTGYGFGFLREIIKPYMG
ncbi:MAG: glycosyltransferase [Flammeovirgaceae bacterium]|nr:MAG: glycosyltransferase [Flammeovirgaceae bacterium]